jgi:hypothetical protein
MVHLASMAVTMPRNGSLCCVLGHNLTLFSTARPKCRETAVTLVRSSRLRAAVRTMQQSVAAAD